jgi:hypothetical protein
MVFKVFRANKQKITGVTFWNLTDRTTWLDNYPVPGRKNYPLLFDANYQPKKAYWDVVNFKQYSDEKNIITNYHIFLYTSAASAKQLHISKPNFSRVLSRPFNL